VGDNNVLIVGASGTVGSAAVEAFLAHENWHVVALSRRVPEIDSARGFEHLAVDLRDPAATRAALVARSDITHVVYAALFEKPGLISGWRERDQMDTNLAMLRNLMEPLIAANAELRHVSLLQGTKAYGSHLHPIPIPARENAPRDPHDNFYWLQEDYLQSIAAKRGFDWTILRPRLIIGGPYGVAMNLMPVIGLYAALCREHAEPFAFPGGVSYVQEAVDARLLAEVFVWAATTTNAAGQYFNVTNGDVFEWRSLWPALADILGVETGPDRPRSMAEYLPAQADTWARIVKRHGLRDVKISELLGESHHYADFSFAYGVSEPRPPAFVSTIKLRQAGFTEFYDTEDTFRYWFGKLMERKVLPAP
jgi:nucleoside-diphosphate-sugar epimerase